MFLWNLAIVVLALPSAFGERRTLQCDTMELKEFGTSTDKHDRAGRDIRDVLLPAAATVDPLNFPKLPTGKCRIWERLGLGVIGKACGVYIQLVGQGFMFELGIVIGALVIVCCCFCLLQSMRPSVILSTSFFYSESMDVEDTVDNLTLVILRSSGEEFATLHAKRSWSGRRVREETSKHADVDEYVCQIVWDNDDGTEMVLLDHQYLDGLGLVDGRKLRAIVRRCCALASGISLFFGTKNVGTRRLKARIWLYEDMSAMMLVDNHDCYGGIAETTSTEGHLNEGGNLTFSSNHVSTAGLLFGRNGRQEIVLHSPVIGSVRLKQSLVEAVFAVRPKSIALNGWITFFQNGEVILRTSRLDDAGTGEATSEASAQLCLWWRREEVDRGSTKISFSCVGDIHDWKQNFDRAAGARIICSGSWRGPIGKRRLLLSSFPSIGNIELTEYPIS